MDEKFSDLIKEKAELEKEISDKLNAFISKFKGLTVDVEISKFYEAIVHGEPKQTIFKTEITITL